MNYFSQWPDLSLMAPDGGRVKASDVLATSKYLVVYIGASWVPDCARITPLVIDLFRRLHVEKDFTLLYISRDTSATDVAKDFASHTKIASPPSPPVTPTRAVPRRRRSDEQSSLSEDLPANFLLSTKGYYGLPFEWMETVAVPLVHHLRVFTYPSVLVFDNTVPIPPPPPANAASSHFGKTRVTSPSSTRSVIQPDASPRIERRECVPHVVSITGRFMLEVLDPTGKQFPWTTLNDQMAAGRRLFLGVAFAVAAVVVAVIAHSFPAFITGGPQEEKRRAERRLQRELRG